MIKKNTFKLLWLVILLPLTWACSQIDPLPIIPQTPSSIVSPSAGSSIVLDIDNPDEEFIFEVSDADFGIGGTKEYIIQVALPETNFANAKDVGESESLQVNVLASDLNAALLELGLEPEMSAAAVFRVRTTIDRDLSALVGSPVELMVTPYTGELNLPFIRVPGAYQSWQPENDNTILYSENSDDVYEGFVHFMTGNGDFKFITGPAWGEYPDYGVGSGPGILQEGGGDIRIPGSNGTYRVKADLENLTYELERIGIWGIIGDATEGGWDDETPMTFNAANNILTITADLVEGEFKFRTEDNTWTHNYGLGPADGVAGAGGDNIPIDEDGNYTITLDMKNPNRVLYTITLN